MICPKCGLEYQDGFEVCSDCGIPLVKGNAQYCPSCGAAIVPNAGRCVRCGATLTSDGELVEKVDADKTNWSWFRRHLNLTLVLVWWGLYVILLVCVATLTLGTTAIMAFYVVWITLTYTTAWWVLRCKRRSLSWLLILGIGLIITLMLENRYDAELIGPQKTGESEDVPPEALESWLKTQALKGEEQYVDAPENTKNSEDQK